MLSAIMVMIIGGTLFFAVHPPRENSVLAGQTVNISPGQSIQAIIDSNPAGTDYVLAAGIYRNQTFTPKEGDTVRGAVDGNGNPTSVLNGSQVVTGFADAGNGKWKATLSFNRLLGTDQCEDDYPRCNYANDIYIDNEPMVEVDALSKVTSTTFYVDSTSSGQGNYDVYIGQNPSGKVIELGITETAIRTTNKNITLKNLVFEKYASTNSKAAAVINLAYNNDLAGGWLIDNVTFQYNHRLGLSLADRSTVQNSKLYKNGHAGMYTGAFYSGNTQLDRRDIDIVLQDSEISYNNYANYRKAWSACGFKFQHTQNAIVRRNHIHHNNGNGAWFDIKNHGILVEDNIVEYNGGSGVMIEISHDSTNPNGTGNEFDNVVRNNTLRYNGSDSVGVSGRWGWPWARANIMIANSENTEVYGNTVYNNGSYGPTMFVMFQVDRGSEWTDPVYGNYVHHNTFIIEGDLARAGATSSLSTWQDFFSNPNANRFDYNTYYVEEQYCNAQKTDTTVPFWRFTGGGPYGLDQTWSQVRSNSAGGNAQVPQELNGNLVCGEEPVIPDPDNEFVISHDVGADYFVIEAEDYKNGGEGVGYHDTSSGNAGNLYRSDNVDIKAASGGGYAVGWMNNGEWLEYEVDVPQTGVYALNIVAGTATDSGRNLGLLMNGTEVFEFEPPVTGDWSTQNSKVAGLIHLPAGTTTFRLEMRTAYADIDKLSFNLVNTVATGCLGDYVKDGIISLGDLAHFSRNYRQSSIKCSDDIIGNDCRLDLLDLAQFAQVYRVDGVCADTVNY